MIPRDWGESSGCLKYIGDDLRKYFTVSAYVAADEKGDVYLAGSSEASLDEDYAIRGDSDIYLMRFALNREAGK